MVGADEEQRVIRKNRLDDASDFFIYSFNRFFGRVVVSGVGDSVAVRIIYQNKIESSIFDGLNKPVGY